MLLFCSLGILGRTLLAEILFLLLLSKFVTGHLLYPSLPIKNRLCAVIIHLASLSCSWLISGKRRMENILIFDDIMCWDKSSLFFFYLSINRFIQKLISASVFFIDCLIFMLKFFISKVFCTGHIRRLRKKMELRQLR